MEGASSRDTFSIIPFLGIVKSVSWHLPQFKKKLGYIESVSWRDTLHNVASIDGGLSV